MKRSHFNAIEEYVRQLVFLLFDMKSRSPETHDALGGFSHLHISFHIRFNGIELQIVLIVRKHFFRQAAAMWSWAMFFFSFILEHSGRKLNNIK